MFGSTYNGAFEDVEAADAKIGKGFTSVSIWTLPGCGLDTQCCGDSMWRQHLKQLAWPMHM